MGTHSYAHMVERQLGRRRPSHPPGMHQRQVQRRRHRRRVQETYMLECQSTDNSTTQAADTDTTRLEQESCTVLAGKGTTRHKRNLQRIDREEQADKAATEIVDLVEQDAQRSAGSLTGSNTPLDMLRVQCRGWRAQNKRRRRRSLSG